METPAAASKPAYRRVLLKLSGEALMGAQSFGIDEPVVVKIAEEIREVCSPIRASPESFSKTRR